MKKILLLALLGMATMGAMAQSFRANAYGSYVFDDSFESFYDTYDYYTGKIKGGFQYGVGLEYVVQKRYGIEVLWLHQSTTAPVTFQRGVINPISTREFDVTQDYILLGLQSVVSHPNGKIEGFGGMLGGIALINVEDPETGREASTDKFAWGVRLGANFWASEKIGIKLQAQLLSVAQATGGGLYFGTGAGVAVSSYSTIYQFGLGGGLVFRFGQSTAAAQPTKNY